jgi:isocitrate dehydrogenase (NAD+)
VPIDFEMRTIHGKDEDNTHLNNALMAIERNGVALMGNIETRMDAVGVQSRNVVLRKRLDLFANIIHAHSIDGIETRHKNVDIVIIRENIEGEYSGMEHEVCAVEQLIANIHLFSQTVPGVVESLKIVTHRNIERISRFAFEFARKNGRKKVTAVHKANIM